MNVDIKYLEDEITEIIFKYIDRDNYAVFLFGSFAKNTIYKDSDIDIGIAGPEPVDNSSLVKIKEDLEKHIKTLRDIDVIDFSAIKDVNFLKIALQEIEVWHKTKKSEVYLNNLKKQIND